MQALTTANSDNWKYELCGEPRPFICTVPVGTRVYVPQDYLRDYLCEPGWHYHKNSLNNLENCYLIARVAHSGFSTIKPRVLI